ncbi:OsmC family protein [Vibrio sp. JC009]|uniref:hypothetical protein n=1 Tax=Vibrio sp. JC009 TaxID=2912314 RepID=UPI0023B1F2FD|nr:hypothetical protein [Vibrio sp. JC009]WED24658.1 OsmC family protein [Vibrio sp. JC009]
MNFTTPSKLSAIAVLTALFVSGSAAAQATTYDVISRKDAGPEPTAYQKTKAATANGAVNENVVTYTERVFNQDTWMLKRGVVQPVGEAEFSAWEMLSDEGGMDYEQAAPNPLSYMTAGIASSLLTQLNRAALVMDLDIKEIKVETKVTFHWADAMTSKWSGYTDKVTANILIDSDEPAEKVAELKAMAYKSWAIGSGLANKVKVDSEAVVENQELHWKDHGAHQGKVSGPVSEDNGLTLSTKSSPIEPQTLEVGKDVSTPEIIQARPFAIIAIAESANDTQRPFMNKIKVRAVQDNYATWDLYADDSRGYAGTDKAPTSRDYFTLGTSFCLMSQLSANDEMYFKKQGVKLDDYRVSHQFNYQETGFMTPEMTGSMGTIITKGIVKSEEEKQTLVDFFYQSLRCCFAGESLVNETEMESNIYLNGKAI